jgi:hypothetical protein
VDCHSEPDPDEGHRGAVKKVFGAKLSLPEPPGIELDTEELKQFCGRFSCVAAWSMTLPGRWHP